MPWFTPSQSFAEGWQPGPQLQAAPISGVLSEILQQRNYERALMQKNIADTIKNVRGEMQANKYLDAAKEAGLVPQDYEAGGVGGATYGTGLAKLIEDKKEADALEAYRTGQLGVSRGHLGVAQAQEARLGAKRPGEEMVTVTIDGVQHQVPLSQVIKHPGLIKSDDVLPKTKLAQDIYRTEHPELELKQKTGMTPEQLNPPGYGTEPGGAIGIGGRFKPPVQRESLQTDPTTKIKAYVPDPEGDYINVSGRRMKYNDYVRLGGKFGQAVEPPVQPEVGTPAAAGGGAANAENLAPDYGVAPSYEAAKPGQSYLAPDGTLRRKSG